MLQHAAAAAATAFGCDCYYGLVLLVVIIAA